MKPSIVDWMAKTVAGGAGLPRAMVAAALVIVLGIAACGNVPVEDVYPEGKTKSQQGRGAPVYDNEKRQTVFGEGGLNIFGGDKKKKENGGGSGIAVNSFLWRASLDTIAFMPLSSADPFGGVIITDWYSPPEVPKERYKMSVYILGRELRADGIKVAVFREKTNKAGAWVTQPVSKDTSINIENQILTRARQLRVAAAQNP